LVDELSASHSTDLQQRAYEVQALLGLDKQAVGSVMPLDASCEDIEVCYAFPLPENQNVDRATQLFFEKIKNAVSKFQKKMKINLDVDNVVFYQCAKLQREIPYYRSCAKMKKSNIYNSEQCKLSQS
jgi:hypothetical protein